MISEFDNHPGFRLCVDNVCTLIINQILEKNKDSKSKKKAIMNRNTARSWDATRKNDNQKDGRLD